MGRPPRDRVRDAAAITAASERLLAGTPLRSASGQLTATELIIESGLRRDVVYPEHQHLVGEFRLKVKAQDHVPTAMQDLSAKLDAAVTELAKTKDLLAAERHQSAYLRRLVTELSVELEINRREQQDAADATVVPFPKARGQARPLHDPPRY